MLRDFTSLIVVRRCSLLFQIRDEWVLTPFYCKGFLDSPRPRRSPGQVRRAPRLAPPEHVPQYQKRYEYSTCTAPSILTQQRFSGNNNAPCDDARWLQGLA